MSDIEVALLGGGGFALEIAEYLINEDVTLIGYYDKQKNPEFSGSLEYLGYEGDNFETENVAYVVASGEPKIRTKMINFLKENNLKALIWVSRYAYFSCSSVGSGTIVCPNASVVGNPQLGFFNLINVNASIGHNVVMGDNVIVAPGARINGWCKIEDDAYIGANAVVLPRGHIGSRSVVSAGHVIDRLGAGKVFFVNNKGRENEFSNG